MKSWLFILFLLTLLIFFSFDQTRSFYCLGKDKCLTVWKRTGGACYIIPGKYYGLVKPNDNFILTTTESSHDVIWISNSNLLITTDIETKIFNKDNRDLIIGDYHIKKAQYDRIYTYYDGRYLRYKNTLDLMQIFIKEDFALNAMGEKLPSKP